MKLLLNTLAGLAIIAYPVCIYFGLRQYSVRHVGYFAMALMAIRFLSHLLADRNKMKEFLPLFFICIAGLLPAIIFNSPESLKAMPVLINANFLLLFLLTLRKPPSMIERFARLQEKDLPDSAIEYCRKVTIVWCFFFVLNASISIWTIFQSNEVWALYNGLISYILIGILFSIEFLVRIRVKKSHEKEKSVV